MKKYDIVCIGRSSIDLYSNDIGEPFEKIRSFAAYVGGCPTNISVGTRRLGLNSAIMTGVGDDPVGAFILHFLNNEKVDTSFVVTKKGKRSSAVILGIEPPDKFPLVFYRDNCADIAITIDDMQKVPFERCKAILISGTGFSKEPSRSATLFAAEQANATNSKVVLDIDYRPDQWPDLQTFGTTIRSLLPYVDIVIGTSEEVKAAAHVGAGEVQVADSQVSNYRLEADQDAAVELILSKGPEVLVLKSGTEGSYIYQNGNSESEHAPGFPVDVQNVLGAGDAFASGFLYGYVQGWEWYRCARLGNACGAIVVTRHGCANFMPTMEEVEGFTAGKGGL
ncbi:5-dehydro-2-deoxygluconokinase [Aliifodinibius sp. S!AR15-10]|uniref:5-dehydro-2-deoxygluconokinase n=1 Tax=Aliifodinibius sp. S!AR15-10 TaxID=2950437 RepID=UPI00285D02EF|nr:5-dehydro-2-deoxygluconokinase [Aliifodinibius sp. S!AR15-10]MDR8391722.1 5-dehydro-2-deoxygluconokinase [Aliifodinibius sp. S!AR15-10]